MHASSCTEAFSEERGFKRGGERLDEGGACDDAGGGHNVLHIGVLLLGQEPGINVADSQSFILIRIKA